MIGKGMANDNQISPKIVFIGCAVLGVDMKHTANRLGLPVDFKFLEAGLHERPDVLKQKLQTAIDHAANAGKADRIVIGYGVCGRGTIGIQSRSIPLVIPKVHDCIAMFLGGADAYRREFKKYPGTYYISAGWHREKAVPVCQRQSQAWFGDKQIHYDDVARQYGDRAARQTIQFLSTWQKNYQRAAFIDTGAGNTAQSENHAREMAEAYGWRFEKISGSPALLEKMLTATASTDDVLVVPPGHSIEFDAVTSTLSAHPLWSGQQKSNGSAEKGSVTVISDEPSRQTSCARIGLGIDAGGTYTDAVIYDFNTRETHCTAKALTTRWDFTVGIRQALEKINRDLLRQADMVALSTTLATNAIVEGDGQKVGLLVMPPYGNYVPEDYPHEPKALIPGQLSINGEVIEPIDEAVVRRVVHDMVSGHQVRAFAVSGFAGAINPEHETAVKQIIQEATGLSTTCGHELSAILDFKVRATTAVLNARIIPRLEKLIADLENALAAMEISAPIVVVKGDGTLMRAQMAKTRPVETIFSGPAASVAGATRLTDLDDALVVDMGGTTTDTAAVDHGRVRVCKSGSIVAGRRTHVRALDIRTAGLGGDSLINREKDRFAIGPRRVAPVAWLGAKFSTSTVDTAVDYLSTRLRRFEASTRNMQILTITGKSKTPSLTDGEAKILALLAERPRSIAELTAATGVFTDRQLPLARLEEQFLIQRCGLTPTDLLHANGRFQRWNTSTAGRFLAMFAKISNRDTVSLRDELLETISRKLALEILKRQLDDEVDPQAIDHCPVCQALINNAFSGGNKRYHLKIDFKRPVIGVGAPISFFLPDAARMIGARAVLPEHADVANAIGAITSKVEIKRRVRIIPDDSGGFLIEGISGAKRFSGFEDADAFARQRLIDMVRSLAETAGTSVRSVAVDTMDQLPEDAGGNPIFIGRILNAKLVGPPDRVIQDAPIAAASQVL
jgi:N-methylhydantoinase A/oxoprolinase/acetone carboxylase beta subunit